MGLSDWINDPFIPYLVLIIFGFLPTEIWRLAGLFFARRLSIDSEVFIWVRCVATVLLAAVVTKLVLSPVGALATVSLIGRIAGIISGVLAYLIFRRSITLGVIVAETVLMTSMIL